MSDNEKQENLANARRKLKKFRDQQPNHGTPSIVSNIISTDLLESNEQKTHRDIEHYQEQLEVHVQTIGVLVAEKTDLSAKLSQSFKQLERKQSELDELYGRLKASRERVQELEKQIQNSTSDVQKRELAAKELNKENDRLKLENIRQSQFIEDLKEKLKQTDDLNLSIARLRSDNEQYQQSNSQMQNHIQELHNQINQMQLEFNREKDLFQNAIEQWTNRYDDFKMQTSSTNISSLTKENEELKENIQQLEQTISELQNETDKIGDYIQLYQQQREQLQKRYQEKDQLIEQLTIERDHLLKMFSTKTNLLPQLTIETKARLAQFLGETSQSLPNKLAFNQTNFYLCSTCTGSVQYV